MIDAPRVDFIPVNKRDGHSQSLYYHHGQEKCTLSDQDYRRARRGYYGMTSHIDKLLGDLMSALDTSGYADNAVVMFSSDHDDMIGERGMWFKKNLYDPAIQVPLVITYPGQLAGRVITPVSLLDVFPTMLAIAGIKDSDITTQLDGKSLLPALQGGVINGPVFAEHIDGGTAAPIKLCAQYIDGS